MATRSILYILTSLFTCLLYLYITLPILLTYQIPSHLHNNLQTWVLPIKLLTHFTYLQGNKKFVLAITLAFLSIPNKSVFASAFSSYTIRILTTSPTWTMVLRSIFRCRTTRCHQIKRTKTTSAHHELI